MPGFQQYIDGTSEGEGMCTCNLQFHFLKNVVFGKRNSMFRIDSSVIALGGIPGKLKGRVGDAPLVGCGGYANEYGAAASSGHGDAQVNFLL